MILNPTIDRFCNNNVKIIIKRHDDNPPENESKKVGVNNVPVANEPITDFNNVVKIANLKIRLYTKSNIIILEKPIFINGSGLGSNISIK